MIVRTHRLSFSNTRTPMPRQLRIGFPGDNMVERIVCNLPDVAANQRATMMLGGEYANMVTLRRTGEDGQYYVDLTAELIGEAGMTEAYVVIDGNSGEVWHSDVLRLVVGKLPDANDTIIERYPDAIEQMRGEMQAHDEAMEQTAERVTEAANRAEAVSIHPPVIGENGNWWLWDIESETYVDSGMSARGKNGDPGKDAPDDVVRYGEPQEMTETQKARARENIGAMSAETEIPDVYTLPTASATVKGGVMVGDGLQMDGDVLRVTPEEYELIDTITVEEDVSLLQRTGLHLKVLSIRARIAPCKGTGNMYISYIFKNSTITSYFLNAYSETNTRLGYSKVYTTNGRWRSGWWTCVNGHGEYANYYENPEGQEKIALAESPLTGVSIGAQNGNVIPTGSIFELWGVRA